MSYFSSGFKISSFSFWPAEQRPADTTLILVFVVLLCLGYVAMGSASIEYASQKYGDPWFHIKRHGLYLCASLLCLWAFLYVPIAKLQRASGNLLLLGFALLLLVLVPGIGNEVNGSQRWIPLGPINLQVSELAKLFVVLYLASYLVRKEAEVRSKWQGFIKPLVVLAAMIVLLLKQPDFGAAVVMLIAVLGVLFLAGVRLIHFFMVILVSVCLVALMTVLSTYRMTRIMTFFDPWAHQYDSGYQLVQSLIAFGRGEWMGLGLGRSIQKMFYLPEAHTDFVFAIIGEEFGFIGACTVLALFSIFIWRMMRLGFEAQQFEQKYMAYVCFGCALLFSAQCFINIGVNTGLLPTKGLTLPFFSFGGSSLLVCSMMMGIVFRCYYELEGVKAALKGRERHSSVIERAEVLNSVGKSHSRGHR